MKKSMLYTVAILLLVVAVAGGTYAFFTSAISANNALNTNSINFEVIYTGGTEITGPMNLSATKEQGLNTTVNIRMAEGSAQAKATLYVNIEKITSNIAVKGFKWEVYGYQDGNQVYSNTGTFDGTKDNDIVNIVNDYQLSEENTSFTAYFWLDGNLLGNEVLGAEFKGFIGAKTENFTGNL